MAELIKKTVNKVQLVIDLRAEEGLLFLDSGLAAPNPKHDLGLGYFHATIKAGLRVSILPFLAQVIGQLGDKPHIELSMNHGQVCVVSSYDGQDHDMPIQAQELVYDLITRFCYWGVRVLNPDTPKIIIWADGYAGKENVKPNMALVQTDKLLSFAPAGEKLLWDTAH